MPNHHVGQSLIICPVVLDAVTVLAKKFGKVLGQFRQVALQKLKTLRTEIGCVKRAAMHREKRGYRTLLQTHR